jgi:hypothetical protein
VHLQLNRVKSLAGKNFVLFLRHEHVKTEFFPRTGKVDLCGFTAFNDLPVPSVYSVRLATFGLT